MKVTKGNKHVFIGMTLDCSKPGKSIIDMCDYVKDMVKEFEEKYDLIKKVNTPAANHLFKVNPNQDKLNQQNVDCYTLTQQNLYLFANEPDRLFRPR